MSIKRVLLVVLLLAVVVAFFAYDLHQYFNFDYLKARQAALQDYHATAPVLSALIFVLFFVVIATLAMPGEAIPAMAAGAIFGTLWGSVIVAIGASIGGTFAFLIARFLFRDALQRRYADRLAAVNAGVRRDGKWYLLSMRCIAVLPFPLVNVLMGLTPIPTWTFYWVTQLGILPAVIIFVNAGTQLGRLESPAGILSAEVLTALCLLGLLGLLPIMVGILRRRRIEQT